MDIKDSRKIIGLVPAERIPLLSDESLYRLTNHGDNELVRRLLSRVDDIEDRKNLCKRLSSILMTPRLTVTVLSPKPPFDPDLEYIIDLGLPFSVLENEEDTSAPESPANGDWEEERERMMDSMKELEEKLKEREEELKEARTLPPEVTAQQRVRMELARRLMEKAGIDASVLGRWGNKDRAGALMATMLDIMPKTCKSYLSDPDLSRARHHETIEKINKLLGALEVDWRL